LLAKQFQKLLARAVASPAGLRFGELQRFCELAGMELVRKKGSHYIYRCSEPPHRLLSIQEGRDGKAKPYQVRQLLDIIEECGNKRKV
jgi:predicted RNA binding protein YcfA (HicA-like mRNA interferase family)